jgi:cyclopropane fatty-acyl-phospholipid synthase-like methyltransferase
MVQAHASKVYDLRIPMNEITSGISRQYDLFQTSLESLDRPRKYLNYGYTVTGRESLEERQERLCMEVFRAAELEAGHAVVDVGFGSGEQDFLLANTFGVARVTGFNIATRQVRYASERAARERPDGKVEFREGEAEVLPGIEAGTIDRVLAIECAFYFDRPRFYRRAAEILKPGGRVVLADISFGDRFHWLMRRTEKRRRVGTLATNRAEWEKHFRTLSITDIAPNARPGAQMSVRQILRTALRERMSAAERREWLKMALATQFVAVALPTGMLHYDLIVLEKAATTP